MFFNIDHEFAKRINKLFSINLFTQNKKYLSKNNLNYKDRLISKFLPNCIF